MHIKGSKNNLSTTNRVSYFTEAWRKFGEFCKSKHISASLIVFFALCSMMYLAYAHFNLTAFYQSRAEERYTLNHGDKPGIFRPSKPSVVSEISNREVNLSNSSRLYNIVANHRWSFECGNSIEYQYQEKYVVDIFNNEQTFIDRVSYKEYNDKLHIDRAGVVYSYIVDNNSMRLIQVSAGGYVTRPNSAKILYKCNKSLIAPNIENVSEARNKIPTILLIAMSYEDMSTVNDIIKSRPIISDKDKNFITNTAKTMKRSVSEPVLQYFNVKLPNINDYRWNDVPWRRTSYFPSMAMGRYSNGCNLFYTEISYSQVVGYWKGDPPKPWKFSEIYISGDKIMLKDEDGSFTILEYNAQYGIKILLKTLKSGAEAPGSYGNWIARCM